MSCLDYPPQRKIQPKVIRNLLDRIQGCLIPPPLFVAQSDSVSRLCRAYSVIHSPLAVWISLQGNGHKKRVGLHKVIHAGKRGSFIQSLRGWWRIRIPIWFQSTRRIYIYKIHNVQNTAQATGCFRCVFCLSADNMKWSRNIDLFPRLINTRGRAWEQIRLL